MKEEIGLGIEESCWVVLLLPFFFFFLFSDVRAYRELGRKSEFGNRGGGIGLYLGVVGFF